MKKAAISGIMVSFVILGIGISYMQFQGKALQGKSRSQWKRMIKGWKI